MIHFVTDFGYLSFFLSYDEFNSVRIHNENYNIRVQSTTHYNTFENKRFNLKSEFLVVNNTSCNQ